MYLFLVKTTEAAGAFFLFVIDMCLVDVSL